MHHKKSILDVIKEKGESISYETVEFMLKFYIFCLLLQWIGSQPGQMIDTAEIFFTALMYGGVFFWVKLLLAVNEK